MAHAAPAPLESFRQKGFADRDTKNEASQSSISWAAVIGGAFVAAAMSLILLSLGAGVGLSSISPYSNTGISSSSITKVAIIWVVLSQIIALAVGGYLAGRLRTKWVNVHTDEVYFRDTAHGFLVWAVSLVLAVAFLASAAGMVGRAADSGVTGQVSVDPTAYYVDSLFRTSSPAAQDDSPMRAEAENILANDLRQGNIPAADKTYLGQLVAMRTGLNQGDAESRVSEIFTEAQQSADAARRAGAHLSYWTFFALLVGAFCASFAATLGGKQRDQVLG